MAKEDVGGTKEGGKVGVAPNGCPEIVACFPGALNPNPVPDPIEGNESGAAIFEKLNPPPPPNEAEVPKEVAVDVGALVLGKLNKFVPVEG